MAICVGCGLDVNGGSGLLEVQLDPAGGITCGASGLAVVGVPVAGVPVSPDACNGLSRHGNGLYSKCTSYISGIFNDPSDNQGTIAIAGPNQTYTLTGPIWTITNNKCSAVAGRVSIMAGGVFTDDLVHNFLVIAHLEVNTNGGGWVGSSPDTTKRVHNNDNANTLNADFNNLEDNIWLTLGAAASVTYQARMIVTVIGASASAGNLQNALHFEIQWNLTSDAC